MIAPVRAWRIIKSAWNFLRDFGAGRFAAELHYRFINRYHDWRLGIQTRGMVTQEQLGIHRADSVEYTPIGYAAIHRALSQVPIPAPDVSFLDLGSGKGRVIAVAATKPYKKVLGVEISAELNGIARANIGGMRRRRAGHVEIIQSDAADFVIPDDINVIFLFNPFFGKTLASVIDNIRASYNARPRPIYILFFNKIHFERFIKDAGYEWIKSLDNLHFYPNYSCGIFQIGNDAGIAEIRPQGAHPE